MLQVPRVVESVVGDPEQCDATGTWIRIIQEPREGRGVRRQVRRGLQLQEGADQAHRQEDEVAVQKPMGQSRGSL